MSNAFSNNSSESRAKSPEPVQSSKLSANSSRLPGVTWGPAAAIAVAIGVYFGGQLLGYLLFVFLYSLFVNIKNFGLNFSRLADAIETISSVIGASADTGTPLKIIMQFLLVLTVEVVSIGLLYIFLRYKKAALAAIGLIRPKLQDLGYAAMGFVVYLPIYILSLTAITALIPSLDVEQKQQLGFEQANTPPELFLVLISLVILPPLVEEIICRGFLYSGLKTRLPVLYAAIITSVLFGAAHLQFGSGEPLLWVAAIDTFILSMVLVYMRERSGSLWPPIGLHMLKNSLAFIIVFVLKTP